MNIVAVSYITRRCQWPRGLRRRSAAARQLRSWVQIPPESWIFVCCECCVLSGRGLYDELITRPEESYRLWCVVECDLETSRMRRSWPALGHSAARIKKMLHYAQPETAYNGRWTLILSSWTLLLWSYLLLAQNKVLTAVSIKIRFLLDVQPCQLVNSLYLFLQMCYHIHYKIVQTNTFI
jgi:hypothetical protein